jgi:hypothetical protein
VVDFIVEKMKDDLQPTLFPVEPPDLSHVVEHRWGRCAEMKKLASTDHPLMPWRWNKEVWVASPPGVGCFKAGVEYTHGGISLQEMVVRRMTVTE